MSCGEPTPPPPPRPSILVIVNRSQFDLQQLFVHDRIDNYRDKSNLLPSPLAVDAQLTLTTISNGPWYVTVVREKVRHGALVAVTTATPIDLQGGTYTLWVFDESFRLWKPERIDGGPRRDMPRGDLRRESAPAADRARPDFPSADALPADATPLLDRRVGEAQ